MEPNRDRKEEDALMRHGRKKPYTEVGIKRLPCAKCGKPSHMQWCACADGLWRPICKKCNITLNGIVLTFMEDPDCVAKMKHYEEKLCEHKN